jgi:hypothetical protein
MDSGRQIVRQVLGNHTGVLLHALKQLFLQE